MLNLFESRNLLVLNHSFKAFHFTKWWVAFTVVMDTPRYWGWGFAYALPALRVDYKKAPTGPHGTYQPGLWAGDRAQKSETISPKQ